MSNNYRHIMENILYDILNLILSHNIPIVISKLSDTKKSILQIRKKNNYISQLNCFSICVFLTILIKLKLKCAAPSVFNKIKHEEKREFPVIIWIKILSLNYTKGCVLTELNILTNSNIRCFLAQLYGAGGVNSK